MEKIYLYRKYYADRIRCSHICGVYLISKRRSYSGNILCHRIASQGYFKSDLVPDYFKNYWLITTALRTDMLYKNPYYEEEIS